MVSGGMGALLCVNVFITYVTLILNVLILASERPTRSRGGRIMASMSCLIRNDHRRLRSVLVRGGVGAFAINEGTGNLMVGRLRNLSRGSALLGTMNGYVTSVAATRLIRRGTTSLTGCNLTRSSCRTGMAIAGCNGARCIICFNSAAPSKSAICIHLTSSGTICAAGTASSDCFCCSVRRFLGLVVVRRLSRTGATPAVSFLAMAHGSLNCSVGFRSSAGGCSTSRVSVTSDRIVVRPICTCLSVAGSGSIICKL